ncbi:MAG: alpha/beta hydrolase [Legionella longbeachae]|nr:alpha/beta hydrolase [Legionella longbeachae]
MLKIISNTIYMTRFILVLWIGIVYAVQAYAFLPKSQPQIYGNSPVAPVQSQHTQEIIVLVHGLMRTSLSMWPLKNYLKRHGYQVYSYSYPSPKYSIQEHGFYLNQFIIDLLIKNPGIKIHFITHSLGGIISREALSKLSKKQLKYVGCLIMLAPPNQGSELAKLSLKILPIISSTIKPMAELSSEQTSYVHQVPIPKVKIGIIAGRYDAKVPPKSARLQGQEEPMIVNSNHTFIMNNEEAKRLIMSFLEKGSFVSTRKHQ